MGENGMTYRDIQDTISCLTYLKLEYQKRRVGWKQYSERMTKNFLKLIKDINPQIPEAQQVPDSVNINRITPRDITLKLLKTKGKKKKEEI